MQILEHTVNRFNGIIIDNTQLPADPQEFAARLAVSLEAWRQDGRQLVWLDLPTTQARLIPEAVEAGFRFHHTGDENLTMTYRLIPNALIPSSATHCIGAGGVVINARQELLVVNERHRRDHSRPYYKLPGGALHPGEHLVNAVIREVYEETGVQAEFERLVCFRHWHGYRFGSSDIYFICRLRPEARPDAETITIQPDEIEDSHWMPVNDYLGSEYVSIFNKQIVRAALKSPGVRPSWVDGYEDATRYEFFMPDDLDND